MRFYGNKYTPNVTTKKDLKKHTGGINDVDSLASDILNDEHAATATIEAICTDMNHRCRITSGRKERGLVLKKKNAQESS